MTFPIVSTLKNGFDAIVSALASSATNVNVSHNGGVVWSGILPASGDWVSIIDGVEFAWVRSLAKSNSLYHTTYYYHSPTDPYVLSSPSPPNYYRIDLDGDLLKARALAGYDVDITVWIQMYPSNGVVGGIVGPVGPTGPTGDGWEAWSNLSLAANWTNYPGQYQDAQYRQSNDGDNVQVRGLVQCSAWSSNLTIGTLPIGYRPLNNINLVTYCATISSCQITVLASGEIKYLSGGAGAGYLSIDNITFSTQ